MRAQLIFLGLTSVLALVAGVLWNETTVAEPPTVPLLEAQLQGRHCQYEATSDGCRSKASSSFLERNYEHWCDVAAIRCLATRREPQATAALVRVLETKVDVETCDGVIPVRSTAVQVLADGGHTSAIGPLRQLLKTPRKMRLSAGAAGCIAKDEPNKSIIEALAKLEK